MKLILKGLLLLLALGNADYLSVLILSPLKGIPADATISSLNDYVMW